MTPANDIKRSRFRILPIPKYLSNKNTVTTTAIKIPFLLFPKISENVNKVANVISAKNKNIFMPLLGSVK